MKISEKIINFLRISIGIIFLISGFAKLTDLVSFKEAVLNFNILPQYSNLFTVTIPCFELISGLCLICGVFKQAAKIILLILLIVFSLAIVIALRQGAVFDCGCFGPINLFSKISIRKLIFNLLLLLGLVLMILNSKINLDVINQLTIISTYSCIIAILIYIPFSNKNLLYEINKEFLININWEELTEIQKGRNTFIFDTRQIELYNQYHIPGALPLPINEFGKYFKKYKKISQNANIVVYCSSLDCMSSTKVAHMLIRRGYKNVFKLSGGIEEWKSHALKIN
ncbi:MAG: DoxX family membrane protein [Candidatus Aminicenantes bacterium]|nr:DoxX family membrane protein [Candidatus Aminicenantes bacterium]